MLIAATGNYAFFNAPGDHAGRAARRRSVVPAALGERGRGFGASGAADGRARFLAPVAAVVIAASAVEFAASFDRVSLPDSAVARDGDPVAIRSFNGYGLFMVMTT